MIAIITMFFCFGMTGWRGGMLSALILTAVVLLGVAATFAATKLLSVTFLCGVPSSFTLEMPSYRRPKVLSILVRSLFDRTLFVLARAVSVAAPAGAILWLAANITVGDASLLGHCAAFLDPLGRIIGLDGVILIAFILGSPANEIVIPIIIMGYTANSTIIHAEGLAQMKELFTINGWTPVTAVCTVVFMLFHWPCITSLLTLRKETGSTKWALLSAVLPTLFGFLLCFLIKSTASLLGI
jgi:ferrous iron transport protein B